MRFIVLSVATLLTLAFVAGCGSGTNRGDVNLYDLDSEWQLGEEISAEIAGEVELVDDPGVRGLVEEIGNDLAAQTELASRDWEFHVVDHPAVNAFAVPGGHVYVHTGLLEAVETEAELAGVLAHEVSHIEARHTTEMLTRAYGIEFVLGLLGDEEGDLERVVEDLVAGGTLSKFSRDAEREADALGIDHLAAAGYPPEGITGFFEALLEERERQPTALEQFFSTHPLTDERLQRALELSEGLEPAPPLEVVDGSRLAEVKRRLAGG